MEGNLIDLSKYRLEKAENNLKLAKKLYDEEIYGAALNRAYYAAFDAMRAVNVFDLFDSSKHSGVIAHFNMQYVKTGIFPPETSSIIRRASHLREKSDYEDFYVPEREETEQVIQEVDTFLKTAQGVLKERYNE